VRVNTSGNAATIALPTAGAPAMPTTRIELLLLIVIVSLLWTIYEIRTNTDALLMVAQACS
jgi:hypothetical protein